MVVAIHQPEHLPWLGLFDKVRQADCVVLLDHVPYRKHYFQNRNRIRSANGAFWLTVPVRVTGRFGQPIKEVQIDREGNPRWRQRCWSSLMQSYQKAPYFNDYAPFFEQLYRTDWQWLVELNEAIIGYVLSALQVQVRCVKSSALGVHGAKGELIYNICDAVGADTYLSGVSGRTYLDLKRFEAASIEVRFQEFRHPVYRQLYQPFIPCLSTVDLLFNCGPGSAEVLKSVGVDRLASVLE
jgi:hypothetical protein